MIKQGLTYEEHEVGAKYETLGRTVTEADVCAFVNLCGFSEGLVIQTGLIHGTGMSYLGSEIKIVAPVLVGDTLRVRVVVTDKRETKKPDRGIVTYHHEVVNHRGEIVLEAIIRRMIKRKAVAAV